VESLQGTKSGQEHGIQKVRYTHDAMIDLILARPEISQNDIALYFNYSVGWVSRVMGSDAFQARLASRKDEVVTPEIRENLENRMAALADQSLDVLQQKLKATGNPDLAVKTLELSTKALGMGARPQNAVQNNTFVVALPPKVADEKTWAAQARGEPAIDVPARPVES
jgi:hypothetical protein